MLRDWQIRNGGKRLLLGCPGFPERVVHIAVSVVHVCFRLFAFHSPMPSSSKTNPPLASPFFPRIRSGQTAARPERSRARSEAKRTLDGEDRAEIIEGEGKGEL